MTDGIIQEVFREFNWQYQSNPRWNRKFNDEQMKILIEKIKQHAKENIPDGDWMECPIEELIGDNQE